MSSGRFRTLAVSLSSPLIISHISLRISHTYCNSPHISPHHSSHIAHTRDEQEASALISPVLISPSLALIRCPGGSFGNQTGLEQVEHCLTTPPGSFSAIGSQAPSLCFAGTFAAGSNSAACDPCPPGTFANVTGSVHCAGCAPGHWCSTESQIECSENTYNPHPAAHLVTNCTRCPERTSTLRKSGATSKADCFCAPLFYLAPETMDVASRSECSDRCCTCPVGSDCSDGAVTLASLPIVPGYFRRSPDHVDVRRCIS